MEDALRFFAFVWEKYFLKAEKLEEKLGYLRPNAQKCKKGFVRKGKNTEKYSPFGKEYGIITVVTFLILC